MELEPDRHIECQNAPVPRQEQGTSAQKLT